MRDWKKWSVGKWGWLEDLHSYHLDRWEMKGRVMANFVKHASKGWTKILMFIFNYGLWLY